MTMSTQALSSFVFCLSCFAQSADDKKDIFHTARFYLKL